MIDSHCHLDHEPLVQNIEDILAKCKKGGCSKTINNINNIKWVS